MTLVPIEALTSRGDRFRCTVLACVLSAGTCADRQARVRAVRTSDKRGPAFASCVRCADGERVRERVGEGIETRPLRVGEWRDRRGAV
jgi:hypothetical protein